MTKRKHSVEADIVATLFGLIGLIVSLPFRLLKSNSSGRTMLKAAPLDHQAIQNRWREVQEMMRLSGASHFRMAVLQADSIFDSVLKSLGASGNTMGERLQSAEKMLGSETYQMIWQAHKLRNRLAHEMDSEVMSWEASQAVATFEMALRELHALPDDMR